MRVPRGIDFLRTIGGRGLSTRLLSGHFVSSDGAHRFRPTDQPESTGPVQNWGQIGKSGVNQMLAVQLPRGCEVARVGVSPPNQELHPHA
jgi:hypothetical protein